MSKQQMPPRKRSPRPGPENTDGRRPGEKHAPAAAERTDPESEREPAAPEAGPRAQQQPVTNQDEQDKITNAGASDGPIADK